MTAHTMQETICQYDVPTTKSVASKLSAGEEYIELRKQL